MAYGDLIHFPSEGRGPAARWAKLEFGSTAGKNEAWLRDALRDHADTLPVRAIDPAFGPLTTVCTELQTAAGRIDNVFVSPNGRLTLVECKLWRNPQARREVVAQILDYAKELSGWDYSELQKRVNARTGRSGNYLFELVKAKHPETVEQDFVDEAGAALRQGRFMLLIAGDGIKGDVKALTELINRNSAAAFTFGMVEVAMFEAPDKSILLQPRLLTSTVLIERTVVIVQGATAAAFVDEMAAADEVPRERGPAQLAAHATMRAWWDPLVAAQLNDPGQDALTYFAPNNVRAAMPWPGTWVLAYRASSPPRLGVAFRGRSGAHLEALRALQDDMPAVLLSLPDGTVYEAGESLSIEVSSTDFADDTARRAWLLETINAFVNELRPRLARELER